MGHIERQSSDEGQIEKLVVALCERLTEILPEGEFEVTVDRRQTVRIRGIGSRKGNVVWLSPVALWSSELPVEDRMQLFLEAVGQRVQKLMSSCRNRTWPTMAARPKVSVGEDGIVVWWGNSIESNADVALRPINLSEIES